MICMLGGDRKKKKAPKTLNGLKEFTLTFKVNIATYEIDKLDKTDLLTYMEDQLKYTNIELLWDAPTLTITSKGKK